MAALTILVALVCIGLSLVAGASVARGQHDAAEQQLARRTALVAEAVSSETGRYVDTLRTVAAATGSFTTLTAAKFAQVAEPLEQMHLAGATSIVFLIPATDAEFIAAQKLWRSRGMPKLTLVPGSSSSQHIFSVFNVPMDGVTTPRVGIDITQAPVPTHALNQARRTGQVTISTAYQLIIDQHLPPGQRQPSFSLTAPVHGPPDARGNRPFLGWLLMGLRGRDFVSATLDRESQDLLDVTLRAQNAAGAEVTVVAQRAGVSGGRDLSSDVDVSVADRRWDLHVQVASHRLLGGATNLPRLVVGAGGLLGLLLAGLVWVLATGRARARAQVAAATRDLTEAEAEARRQASLLAAILDNISDGVAVTDANGAFLLYNPAARAMLGVDAPGGDPRHWATHFGFYPPEGLVPFPADELPLVRAMAGESVDQVDMVIRNPERTERTVVSASARPLPIVGDHTGAVAVFHDVTAQREREADLKAFAGVAAHDLSAPLAAIGGFVEILTEDLTDGVDPASLAATLTRVASAVQRMRRLIEDLLSYATARDRCLHREPVDLNTLIIEVITERTAHLRVTPSIRPDQVPDIVAAPLPTVDADKAMTRQLLDNLIGNAIKYTPIGEPAHIEVSAAPDSDGWTRVQIADHGIGIPADDQSHVFTSFHRAAAHTSYTGTGLGLAICHRVINRHGGTITASDNPGGGTRIQFTLPTTEPQSAVPRV